ncbi:hypothetical protein Tco_0664057 [Tanacetum coccineum]
MDLDDNKEGQSIFYTIITSLKALDKSFSSRNHVSLFLRAFSTKWSPKVTAIEESKDLSTLLIDELIGNLKVYEVVLEKDSEASKSKKEKYKSFSLKAKKVSSDEEVSCSDGDDTEYAIPVRDFKKLFRRKETSSDNPHDDKKNFRRAKEGNKGKEERSDSEEDDDPKKDKICLMAHDTNEVLASAIGGYRAIDSANESLKPILQNRSEFVQVTKKTLPSATVGNVKQTPALKVGQGLGKSKIQTRPKMPLRRPNTLYSKSDYDQVRLKVKLELDEWIKDSDCSRHMMGNKDLFLTYEAINRRKRGVW